MQPEQKVNVLLVDDHPENLLALEAILDSLGQNLVKAHSGAEALRCLLNQDFAVILLDVQMPGMDGFETATLIRNRERSRHTPIIFLTAFSTSDNLVLRGYSLGAVDYLFKPIEPEILTSKVVVFVDLFKKTAEVKRQAAQLAAINAELRENEARFRSLSACSPVGIFLTDIEGCCTYTNPRCQAICGSTFEESCSEGWLRSVHPEDRDWVLADWSFCTREGQEYSNEFRLLTQEGIVRWVHVRSSPMLSDKGELIGHVGTLEDITERQRNHEVLRQSEERLRLALKAARMGTWDWDISNGKFTYSINTEVNLGLAPGSFDGTYNSFLTRVHPEDYELVTTTARRTIESGADYDIEFRVIWPDGTVHWVASKGQVYYDKTSSLAVYMAGVDMDITSRKQTEAALRESENRFQAFMSNSPTLAFMKDKEGRYVYVNEPLERLFNVKLVDLLGLTDFDWLPEETARQVSENDLAVLSTGQPAEVIETIPTPDGCSQYWLVFKFRFQDVAGRQLVGGVAVDVTARQQAEAEIAKALAKEKELSELKSHFVSTTSHEFRTPLTTILSSAYMLEKYGHKWVEQKKLEHLHRIQTAGQQMTQLLDDVLLVSKAEAGKLEFKPDTLDLAEFCCDLVEEMQLIAGVNHTIDFVTQGPGTNVCLDEKLLRHILTNLLSNAIKYSPAGGTVHFNVVCDQKVAIFCIIDQGIGIPKADQAQLFESFHRASNVGTISGTGLGLAIVKKSVDLHGGEITIASVVGVGTTFTVTIPLHNWVSTDDNDSGN